MVSSVTNIPYSYYNILNPTAAPVVPPADSSANNATDNSATTTPTKGVQLSSNVLSLLQQLLAPDTNTSTNPTATLLGASTDTGGLNSLLNKPQGDLRANTYTTLLSAAYSGASQKASAASIAKSGSYIQNVLNDYQAAQNAFNPTPTSAQVQAVIEANSYLPNGTKITT